VRVTLHFDPTCPWTWLTSRWLLRAAASEGFEVGWAPFAIVRVADGEHAEGRFPLRVIQHLVERGDDDAVDRYYDAYGELAHRQGRHKDEALAVEAARAAELDEDAVAAAGDPSLDAAVDAATDAAFAAAGPNVGSPILHWTDAGGEDVWVFGPLFDRVVDAACAGEVWRSVRQLAVHGFFKELKRGREDEPDLRGS
jgi:2-hydroxychromene-2-carboxylate isomerase